MGNGTLDGAAISPDGKLFFSGNGYGLHVWDATIGEGLALVMGLSASYGEMWITPDQQMLLITSWNGLLTVWGAHSGK